MVVLRRSNVSFLADESDDDSLSELSELAEDFANDMDELLGDAAFADDFQRLDSSNVNVPAKQSHPPNPEPPLLHQPSTSSASTREPSNENSAERAGLSNLPDFYITSDMYACGLKLPTICKD